MLTTPSMRSSIDNMKLIATIKLAPTQEQAMLLQDTLKRCNAACNWISERAWEHKCFQVYRLQKEVYLDVKQQFGLTAQAVVRSVKKVVDSYRRFAKKQRSFRRHAAQPYDDRIFRFCKDDVVSLWTLTGREKIPFVCGEHQRRMLEHRQGEVELMFVRGQWFIAAVCDIDEPETFFPEGVLGVDLGIVNLATDSDGNNYSGATIDDARRKHQHRRKNLQKKGTKSAKRKLKQVSGQQARYQRDKNHCISKAIVQNAQRSRRGIALEELTGIRDRVKARRKQRARLHNWGFAQLRSFIEYKARLVGVPVYPVDPRNSSRECPACAHISKRNRPTRDHFSCQSCGFAGPADHIAALNLSARAVVNRPMVGGTMQHQSPTHKPSTLVEGC